MIRGSWRDPWHTPNTIAFVIGVLHGTRDIRARIHALSTGQAETVPTFKSREDLPLSSLFLLTAL